VAQAVQRHELWETQIDGSQVLVGVYGDARGADQALAALKAAGFDPENVNMVRSGGEEVRELVRDTALDNRQVLAEPEAERMEGQVAISEVSRVNAGMAVGLVAGAIAGAATELALRSLTGLGDALRSFGIWSTVVMALVGAGFGMWAGSLAGMAVPDEDVSYYTADLERGAILLAVRTNRIDEAIDLFRSTGARNFQEQAAAH